jgi:hypothetical protein
VIAEEDVMQWERVFDESGNLDDRRVSYLMTALQQGRDTMNRLEKLIYKVTRHKVDTGQWAAQRRSL